MPIRLVWAVTSRVRSTRAFFVLTEPARTPTRPPLAYDTVGARSASAAHWVGEWAGAIPREWILLETHSVMIFTLWPARSGSPWRSPFSTWNWPRESSPSGMRRAIRPGVSPLFTR